MLVKSRYLSICVCDIPPLNQQCPNFGGPSILSQRLHPAGMERGKADQNGVFIKMKILMYGWEFPPIVNGGLGIACFGIVQSLLRHPDLHIHLVLPQIDNIDFSHDRLDYLQLPFSQHSTHHFKVQSISALLHPYVTAESYNVLKSNVQNNQIYGQNLLAEVYRYAEVAGALAQEVEHDVIHAHDWLTILAGIKAKKSTGKPLIFHVHSLESDRSPYHVNPAICEIERQGLEIADTIIAVSKKIKNNIIHTYHISPEKIFVVYNGVLMDAINITDNTDLSKNTPIVLFLGRVTEQKGPYYFIKAAEKILTTRQNVTFVIGGIGDQLPSMMETVARLGISHQVHFTGFLDRTQVAKAFQMSDVYVMPSVSEPFGISCLEALSYHLPVIISKQSGVAEILQNVLKVDFWDIDQLANHIIALLDYPVLKKEMLLHAKKELAKLTWDNTAKNIIDIYGVC